MDATGHYWKNPFAALVVQGFAVALPYPLRTRCVAGEELQRTQTDAIDALGIARVAAQNRPPACPTARPRSFGSSSGSALAWSRTSATAAAFQGVSVRRRAGLRYAGRHTVGADLATAVLPAAARSLGEDLDLLRRRLRARERALERRLDDHEVGRLLTTTTIDGIGPQTSARLVATFGDLSGARSGAALAASVGAIPALRQSGKRTSTRAGLTPFGTASLRAKHWMPVLGAVRTNPWLRDDYNGLIARGKLPKVPLGAATRKLLHAIYSVATHRRPFVPHPVAAEARP